MRVPTSLVFTSTAALALSCVPQPRTGPNAGPPCSPPTTATKFDVSHVDQLTGVYALSLVADSFPKPGARTFGQLSLRANTDTVHPTRERPLLGTTELNLDAIFAPYSHDPTSLDPKAPGVYFDSASGAFAIGVQPSLKDGMSTSLIPALVWPDGFSGRWTADYGISSPLNPKTGKPAHVGGTFCAVRTRGAALPEPKRP